MVHAMLVGKSMRNRPCKALGACWNIACNPVGLGQQILAALAELFAIVGHAHRARGAMKQARAELCFQLLDTG